MGGMEEFKDKASNLANKAQGARKQGNQRSQGERSMKPQEQQDMDPMESVERDSQGQRRPDTADRGRNRAQEQDMESGDDSARDWS